MLFLFSHKTLNQRFAALGDVTVGCLEIARVPWVGNVTATVCEVKELQYLAIGVGAEDAVHIADICAIHTDEQIVFGIVGTGELSCFTSVKGNLVFRQDSFCTTVNVIADLLGGGGGGLGGQNVRETTRSHHIKKHKFCHWTAADVAVTYEHYSLHNFTSTGLSIVIVSGVTMQS